MDCNLKSSVQWEWDNLVSFGASATEIPRKLQPLEWEIDDLDPVSLCSSGFGCGGLSSDIGHAFSRSSKSTSISSSSTDMRTYNFTPEAGEVLQEDLCISEELAKGIGTSPPSLEPSFGSGEPILGLKLGKRTYFEDVCAGGNNVVKGQLLPEKRAKSIPQSLQQAPRCQVEGCNLDLSSAKDYHRKHRVCGSHSKCPIVLVGGLERRFCQQCSRFHGLSEFDGKKRSCRRRLTDHNARRRKSQPEEPMQLHPALSYDGKQQMNLMWNKFACIDTRSEDKFLWEATFGSKPITPRELETKPVKIETFDGRMHSNSNKRFSSTSVPHRGFGYLPHKTRTARTELFIKETEEEVRVSSQTVGGFQDRDGALSLLSNATSWVPFEARGNTLEPVVAHQLGSSLDNMQTDLQVFEPAAPNRDTMGSQFQLLRGQFSENYHLCPNQFNR
ncbi:PREDICTED: squamosa promoter-binding-like protein 2 [Tarenaya hassleriana]|uniref:squamosa promoter-binding-like protein 2 n=1 Tax=Tarenaya hassleriana TaxID=28532 RepID=UPI00053CA73E|nr:PREDICTED: squamosa promoter-binding-like protein 2 [Tarenaya hassleriana]XP_010538150.1 PREDICTED: squamosa promoter-binding-like protein 2 [Tarenaya hassleriana]XP_010538151.1 PREDICTED: squamosa promoter-binding-like protein 2 [Tarenaya hassleriana]XP_010538152.1 PREDICTED: squamosa promoter-binding-like protein 2 [Tarenaya hassleriana]XP_010538153.1 PREDICTED: squamosa promoter-binding-like protein 2 [Tarenaya hassleriana]